MEWIVRSLKGDSEKSSTLGYEFGIIRASDDRNGELEPRLWSKAEHRHKEAV